MYQQANCRFQKKFMAHNLYPKHKILNAPGKYSKAFCRVISIAATAIEISLRVKELYPCLALSDLEAINLHQLILLGDPQSPLSLDRQNSTEKHSHEALSC